MTAEELNWLLQTIKDPASAERFILAQYERGRISFQLMKAYMDDVHFERGGSEVHMRKRSRTVPHS